MDFGPNLSMTELNVFSKDECPEEGSLPADQQPSDYYYDDATGYQVYEPELDDEAESEPGEEE